MTHEEQIARLEAMRLDLNRRFNLSPLPPSELCADCHGAGVDPGSLREPELCKRCAGAGNESRLVEED